MDVPASLKVIKPYLQHAKQISKADPLVSYYCKYYAATLGVNSKPTDQESKMYLLGILDDLDREKKNLRDKIEDPNFQAPYVTLFVDKIFDKADAEDRAGNATKATGRTFYAASIFYNILRQFGELDPEIQEKVKYSKWKAADITTAFKEGRRPVPGPAGGDDFSELDNLGGDSENDSSSIPTQSNGYQETNGNHYTSSFPDPPQSVEMTDKFQFVDFNTQSFSDNMESNDNISMPSSFAQVGEINYSPPSQQLNSSQPFAHSNNVSIYPNSIPTSQPPQFQQIPNYSQPPTHYTPPQITQQPQVRAPQYTPPQTQHVQQNVYHQLHTPHQPHFNQSQPQLNHPASFNPHLQSQSQPISQVRRSDPEANRQAHRYAKFAVSALQFEDVPTAVLNIKKALGLLGVHVP